MEVKDAFVKELTILILFNLAITHHIRRSGWRRQCWREDYQQSDSEKCHVLYTCMNMIGSYLLQLVD